MAGVYSRKYLWEKYHGGSRIYLQYHNGRFLSIVTSFQRHINQKYQRHFNDTISTFFRCRINQRYRRHFNDTISTSY